MYFGNADTYEDYQRIKRTVTLRYAVVDPVLQEKVGDDVKQIDQEMLQPEAQAETNGKVQDNLQET